MLSRASCTGQNRHHRASCESAASFNWFCFTVPVTTVELFEQVEVKGHQTLGIEQRLRRLCPIRPSSVSTGSVMTLVQQEARFPSGGTRTTGRWQMEA